MVIGRESLENMLKLSEPKWRTSISQVEPDQISIRGYAIEDLIGNISFPEMVFLLLKGYLPSKDQKKMFQSILVSFCDHGITPPSTQASRLMASAGSPMNVCVSGGLMAFGKHHAGALERCMRLLQESIRGMDKTDSLSQYNHVKILSENIVHRFLVKGEKIPGYGHRYHQQDPRARKLIELAKKYDCLGIHSELALAINKIISEKKDVNMNIDGSAAGILSDMGFDWSLGTGIFMLGRIPGLIAHVYEEKTREQPFRKLFDTDEIVYDGFDKNTITY